MSDGATAISSFYHSDFRRHSPFELRHFCRKRRPLFRGNNENDSDSDEEEGKELPAGETDDQCGIRFAEALDHNPKNRVTNKKEPGQDAIRLSHSGADEPKDREQHDSFEERFIELRRMTGRQN